jgi:uncharacterized membrane protein YeiB
MRHPFESVPAHNYKLIFVPLLVLTLATLAVFRLLGDPLQTDAAPQGIVSFEFAGDVATAQSILDSWDTQAQAHAGFNLGFDFVFLALYSNTIGLACVWVGRAFRERRRSLATVGRWLAWGQWLAALLDSVENVALLVLLLGTPAAPWPQIARWCALPKFGLILVGLVYVVLGLILRLTGLADADR